MLTQVNVTSALGALLSLPLDDITEGYSVQDIQGLDPVKATIVSSGYATQDGEQYHSARREKRNIVMQLGLEADYADTNARGLRNRLYGFFMPKSEVNLEFLFDDDDPVTIGGRVESFEAPLFTEKPIATISILNFDPDFIGSDIVYPGFSVKTMAETDLVYDGTVETGFLFKMTVNENLPEFSIKLRSSTNEIRSMDFTASLQPGDVVEVNTSLGQKGVYLTRGSTRSSLLYALSPYSPWHELYPGVNHVRVTTANGGAPFTIEYTNKYGGL